jgi:hypothetical protein
MSSITLQMTMSGEMKDRWRTMKRQWILKADLQVNWLMLDFKFFYSILFTIIIKLEMVCSSVKARQKAIDLYQAEDDHQFLRELQDE